MTSTPTADRTVTGTVSATARAGTPRPVSRTVTSEQKRGIALIGSEITMFMVAYGLVGPLTFVPLFVSHGRRGSALLYAGRRG